MVCDEHIPKRMLINLIAKGSKSNIAEKVLYKDPETIADLLKFSAKRAESTLKITKRENNIIVSIENMEERLLSKLSDRLQSVMTLSKTETPTYNWDHRSREKTTRHQNRHFDNSSRNFYGNSDENYDSYNVHDSEHQS